MQLNLPTHFSRVLIDAFSDGQYRVIVIDKGVSRGYGASPQEALNSLTALSQGELIFHSEPSRAIAGIDLSTLDLDL